MKSRIKLNGVLVSENTVHFSAGEVQLAIPHDLVRSKNFVEAEIKCSDGIMLLLQLASVLGDNRDNLYLGYLPYSRYDRVEESHDALSLKVFCNLINSLGFSKVCVDDCHSDVGLALLDNCTNMPQHDLVMALVPELETYDAIVSPDAGAIKKANKLAKILQIPVIKCDKVRDFKTGKILSFSVDINDENRGAAKILIVDDICDGGGTFVGLAEELHNTYPIIDLYVTHGIFSKGASSLFDAGISKVFAFHDWTFSEQVQSFSKF